MNNERRAENRHVIPAMWATIETIPKRYNICDIGRANARLKDAPDDLKAGELRRFTFYLTLMDGRAVAVPVKGTVTRVQNREAAITYDPPTRSWRKILSALSRQETACA